MQIPLKTGDRVISTFPYRDYVLVITMLGEVFRIFMGGGPDFKPETVRIERI